MATITSVGIVGGAGYAGGELVRLLLRHPAARLAWVHSRSQAGELITTAHPDLLGDTDLHFTGELPSNDQPLPDVVFLCLGHGESGKLLVQQPHLFATNVIDLSQDFRGQTDGFVYGLPEWQRERLRTATRIANPGCFATAIQLALLPLAAAGALRAAVHVSAITGSTGAGQALSDTTHFSWRTGNVSVYKAFTHQHLREIGQSLAQLQPGSDQPIHFIPYRGNFARGILASCYTTTELTLVQARQLYADYYADHPFTHLSPAPVDVKQTLGTNKCLLHLEKHGDQLLVTSVLDNLTKGASGQAVQNFNLMRGYAERTGLELKSTAF